MAAEGDSSGAPVSRATSDMEAVRAPGAGVGDSVSGGEYSVGLGTGGGSGGRGERGAPWFLDVPVAEYESQLAAGVSSVRRLFTATTDADTGLEGPWEALADGRLDVFASPPTRHRVRCRFALVPVPLLLGGEDADDSKPDGDIERDTLAYGMYDRGEMFIVPTSAFVVAAAPITTLMDALLDALNGDVGDEEVAVAEHAQLREGVTAATFLCAHAHEGGALVTMIYGTGKRLGTEWRPAAAKLRGSLTKAIGAPVHIVGRAKGQVVAVEEDTIVDTFHLADGRTVKYKKTEGVFTNPNASVCISSLDWLCSSLRVIRPRKARKQLLELFCGNGNHTVALAQLWHRIVAVEISGRLCDLAVQNCELNGIPARRSEDDFDWSADVKTDGGDVEAVSVMQCPAERLCRHLTSTRASVFDALLVDPPRKGLDEFTLRVASGVPYILYISCNPEALRRDVEVLRATHRLAKFAVFDHFPYTSHLECGAMFVVHGAETLGDSATA